MLFPFVQTYNQDCTTGRIKRKKEDFFTTDVISQTRQDHMTFQRFFGEEKRLFSEQFTSQKAFCQLEEVLRFKGH